MMSTIAEQILGKEHKICRLLYRKANFVCTKLVLPDDGGKESGFHVVAGSDLGWQ